MSGVESQRRSVEDARAELRESVDQLGQVAEATRGELVETAKRAAVPVAVAVAGVALVALAARRRRRRRSAPVLDLGPFSLHPRR